MGYSSACVSMGSLRIGADSYGRPDGWRLLVSLNSSLAGSEWQAVDGLAAEGLLTVGTGIKRTTESKSLIDVTEPPDLLEAPPHAKLDEKEADRSDAAKEGVVVPVT